MRCTCSSVACPQQPLKTLPHLLCRPTLTTHCSIMFQGKPGDKGEGHSMLPLKKNPMVTMPKEELDDAITRAVTTPLLEQHSNLNTLIQSAVKEVVNSILIPQLAELQIQIQHTVNSVDVLAKGLVFSCKAIQSNSVKFNVLQATVIFTAGGPP